MGRSLAVFVTALGRGVWFMIVDIIGGGIGTYQMTKTDFSVGWTTFTAICLVGFVIGSFVAFHKLRVERDAAIAVAKSIGRVRVARSTLQDFWNDVNRLVTESPNDQWKAADFRDRCSRFLDAAFGPQRARQFLEQCQAVERRVNRTLDGPPGDPVGHDWVRQILVGWRTMLGGLSAEWHDADVRPDFDPVPWVRSAIQLAKVP